MGTGRGNATILRNECRLKLAIFQTQKECQGFEGWTKETYRTHCLHFKVRGLGAKDSWKDERIL
jgi:hypothetical protein